MTLWPPPFCQNPSPVHSLLNPIPTQNQQLVHWLKPFPYRESFLLPGSIHYFFIIPPQRVNPRHTRPRSFDLSRFGVQRTSIMYDYLNGSMTIMTFYKAYAVTSASKMRFPSCSLVVGCDVKSADGRGAHVTSLWWASSRMPVWVRCLLCESLGLKRKKDGYCWARSYICLSGKAVAVTANAVWGKPLLAINWTRFSYWDEGRWYDGSQQTVR